MSRQVMLRQGYHPILPQELFFANQDVPPVTLQRALYVLAGKRATFAGCWQGKSVVVKLYLQHYQAAARASHDLTIQQQLTAAGVLTPKLYYAGWDHAHSMPVHLYDCLQPSADLAAILLNPAELVPGQVLLEKFIHLLAAFYRHQVFAADIHLGNFILQHDRLITLDFGHTNKVSQRYLQKHGLRMLARLFAEIHPVFLPLLPACYREFVDHSGYAEKTADWANLALLIRQFRQQKKRKYLRRINQPDFSYPPYSETDRFFLIHRRASQAVMTLCATPERFVAPPIKGTVQRRVLLPNGEAYYLVVSAQSAWLGHTSFAEQLWRYNRLLAKHKLPVVTALAYGKVTVNRLRQHHYVLLAATVAATEKQCRTSLERIKSCCAELGLASSQLGAWAMGLQGGIPVLAEPRAFVDLANSHDNNHSLPATTEGFVKVV